MQYNIAKAISLSLFLSLSLCLSLLLALSLLFLAEAVSLIVSRGGTDSTEGDDRELWFHIAQHHGIYRLVS